MDTCLLSSYCLQLCGLHIFMSPVRGRLSALQATKAGESLCFFLNLCDVSEDWDSRVEAVDKIRVLYFWQSHLAADEDGRGGKDAAQRVIVMELSEVWECWMKWGPKEWRKTKVEKGGLWMTLQAQEQTEKEENWFSLNHVCAFFFFFATHCYSSNVSAHRPVAISCSPPLFLTFIPPQWLKMCVCFSAKLHHTQPLFHELFPPRIFTCSEASNCQRPPVTSAIFSFPPSSSYEEKYLFSFIKASYLWGGRKLQCLQSSACAHVWGECSDAGGYYGETEMRQEIPLIGNKNTILSI